ncbi:hypothetical protein PUN71_007755 [Arthrobacter sp. NQ7]|uniref:hypothetical protein n=1 Tax=Arthrobacter sp. NQ7 TaxID=3032303 RepID=UPI00240F5669|nr:hypothetical protein [Arthrobacter sp. NQ7]MDJ0457087.1 hypothetical protein [Arthrobacter sp. NQ7]
MTAHTASSWDWWIHICVNALKESEYQSGKLVGLNFSLFIGGDSTGSGTAGHPSDLKGAA